MKGSSTSILRSSLPADTPVRRLGNVHFGPLIAAFLLSLIGVVTVASASELDSESYFERQALWIVVGLIAVLVVFLLDYHVLVDLSPFFYFAGLVALVLVLVVGHEAGGARSWLRYGFFNVQPSELQKIATALLLTRYLAGREGAYLRLKEIITAAVIVGIPMVLIAWERDMGGAAMFLPLLGGALLVAGIQPRQLVVAGLLGVLACGVIWTYGMKPYQKQRIMSFLSPGDDPLGAGYQARQAKIAVGSGQLTGQGYGHGTQSQLRFLPARHTDFVVAVLAEEWGFLGVAAVLALYSFFISSVRTIAARSRDRTGILLLVSLVSVICFHLAYNTGMVVGLLPITGIPLPFVSYGGSFMLFNFIVTGLILNVDYRRYVNR